MKNIMISAALCFLLGGCTLNEENVNCYEANLFANINLLTTTRIDSTKLSCNNKDFRFFNESENKFIMSSSISNVDSAILSAVFSPTPGSFL